jgi:subtilisin family serine protease
LNPLCLSVSYFLYLSYQSKQRLFKSVIRKRVFECIFGFLVSTSVLAEAVVTVYIMDNGIRTDHVVFKNIETEVVDLLRSVEPGPESTSYGDHATLVAGLIVERAPKVKLISVRTLHENGTGNLSNFLKGVHWITNHHPSGKPAVANLSLGGMPGDPRIEKLVAQAINQLVEDGVTVVVAAGNDGKDVEDRIPSTLDSVISVGAASTFNFRLISSNYGSCVDVFAWRETLGSREQEFNGSYS